ncbi:MAG: hypothetical protein ACRECV_00140 [Xanthobacteraceae bacterium]
MPAPAAALPPPAGASMRATPPPHITILTVKPADIPGTVAAPPLRPVQSKAAAQVPEPTPRSTPQVSDQKQIAGRTNGDDHSTRFVLFVLGLGISIFFGVIIVIGAARSRGPTGLLDPDEAWRRRDLLMDELTDSSASESAADSPWYQEPPRRRQPRQFSPPPPVPMSRNSAAPVRRTAPIADHIESVES